MELWNVEVVTYAHVKKIITMLMKVLQGIMEITQGDCVMCRVLSDIDEIEECGYCLNT
jgi:hypothetical protein